jgi:hypothetical protein
VSGKQSREGGRALHLDCVTRAGNDLDPAVGDGLRQAFRPGDERRIVRARDKRAGDGQAAEVGP